MLSTFRILSRAQSKHDPLLGLTLKASICHKSQLPDKKVYQWPYKTKQISLLNFWMDPWTEYKLNENSKIIVVEGNIECGKDDFCRRLADELGMYYMPAVDLDGWYRNKHGFDYRGLNPLLPERLRHCDWEMFHECPNRHSVVLMQIWLFRMRLFQYIMAVSHMMNTGQGVVLNRSCFGEKVIVNAMHDVGWLPKGYLRDDGMQFYDYICYYDNMRNLGLATIPPPHAAIYLETPVDVCMKNIKNSKDPMIANSKAHTKEFLEAIEDNYEQVMQKYEHNGNVLTYEYTKPATNDEILDVVDDLSELNWEYDKHDTKFQFWEGRSHFTKSLIRWDFTSLYPIRNRIRAATVLAYFDIAGLGDSCTMGDLKLRHMLYENHIGDLGYLLKASADPRYKKDWRSILGISTYEDKLYEAVAEFK